MLNFCYNRRRTFVKPYERSVNFIGKPWWWILEAKNVWSKRVAFKPTTKLSSWNLQLQGKSWCFWVIQWSTSKWENATRKSSGHESCWSNPSGGDDKTSPRLYTFFYPRVIPPSTISSPPSPYRDPQMTWMFTKVNLVLEDLGGTLKSLMKQPSSQRPKLPPPYTRPEIPPTACSLPAWQRRYSNCRLNEMKFCWDWWDVEKEKAFRE